MKKPTDEVDEAVASARRAIGKLVRLLAHEDQSVMNRAIRALVEFGDAASEPLAANLLRAKTTRFRGQIIVMMRGICKQPGPNIREAILRTVQKEPDERVRTMAHSTLSYFMDNDLDRDLQRAREEEPREVKPIAQWLLSLEPERAPVKA
jgi:HEAT repeat protein